jgi:putative hydrolase of the HAD superfamily
LIKSVIFDIGQVLVPFDWQRGYRALSAHSPYPPEEVRRRIKETGLFAVFELGRIQPEELARRICAILEMEVGFEQFRELWSSIFLPETLVPEEMLSRLQVGCRLLLLSNTDVIHYTWLVGNYPIFRHFHDRVLSFELGCRKPEPEIYREAIARAGCQAGEIFFTDDRADNVAGAIEAGIDAVEFQSAAQIERELTSRGLSF